MKSTSIRKTRIWIDTGGTFTDCIIQHSDERKSYVKVLSDGSLRGQVVSRIGSRAYKIKQNWPIRKDILADYHLTVEGSKRSLLISSFDVQDSILYLESDIDLPLPFNVRISAEEEAPILAIRIGLVLSLTQNIKDIDLKLGTTKGTNALLESKGAKVLLICTKGFKDLSLIGTQQRPNIFQIDIPEPNQLFTDVIEIEEYTNSKGEIINYPSSIPDFELNKLSYEAIAICFKNAYLNGTNESEVASMMDSSIPISISSELSSDIKLLNRTQSTLINAYLDPILNRYFTGIKSKLDNTELFIMASTGTLVKSDLFRSMDSLLSGPAGGLKGAVNIAKSLDYHQIISFDMGGTSTDVARYSNGFDYQYRSNIGGFETSIPSLSIETVAAGGGSICYYEDGQLKVGPQSAGANPGPASYGMGGPLTITDVNLLLGKLYINAFQFPLNLDHAEAKLIALSERIKLSKEEILKGFEKIANQKMAAAIRKISINKGFHTKDYTMVSFGGAGGLHACKIAEDLEVKTLIFPYASGLLSAYGIGKSIFEKIYSHSVLETITDQNHQIAVHFKELETKAFDELGNLSYDSAQLHVKKRWISISIKGQEGAIDIDWNHRTDIIMAYTTSYESIFGFLPDQFLLEVRHVHIIISEFAATEQKDRLGSETKRADHQDRLFNVSEDRQVSVYDWSAFPAHSCLEGPAILYNDFGSVFIENDWKVEISEQKQAVANFFGSHEDQLVESEVINLTVFSNRFQQIAEEMGAQLQKTAFSVNVKERLDFSCGILDPQAQLIANAPHIPVHLGSLGMCARLVLEKLSIGKGDIIITNHPKYGGSHLPDITLLMGVFDDENNLVAYLINRAHHAEIGGSRPGSMPPDANNLEQEGIVFLPQYLAKSGRYNWTGLAKTLNQGPYPSRAIAENIADIKAAVASLKAGEKAIQDYCKTMGKENLFFYMNKLLRNTSNLLADSLKSFESRVLHAREEMDDSRAIQVAVSFLNGTWIFNFDGTSGQHPGNLNANESIVHSAIMYVLRLIVNRDIPLNEGLMTNIEVKLPNSFLNPKFSDDPKKCPAVVGGNTEVSQRLVDTLIKAFGLAACSQGTMNNLLFGNEGFGYYETICGGTGASENQAGRSAIHQHMTNTRITDAEDLERNYPVRLHEFSIRKNSGGDGTNKGGDGIVREIEFLEPVEFTLISQHRKIQPYGMNGGGNGMCGAQKIIRKNGDEVELAGVDQANLNIGDRIRIETPGGGAWGKEF